MAVADWHRVAGPPIGEGVGLTVMIFVAVQPETVYDIVVVPAVTPVTMPEPLMIAVAVALLVHVPDGVLSLRVMVEPVQAKEGPVIIAGAEITDTVVVTMHPVPNE